MADTVDSVMFAEAEEDNLDAVVEEEEGASMMVAEELERLKDDPLIRDALKNGTDIDNYTRRIEVDLKAVERDSIRDYIKESENLAQLHRRIKLCDDVLGRLEGTLSSFQSDLGSISSEIRSLQQQSLAMNVKLRNRKQVEEKLANFIDGISVPESLVEGISESEVNEMYLDYLLTLRKKLAYLKSDAVADASSLAEVEPELEKLRLRAVTRVKEFLIEKILQLGRPKTNFQILQQNVLLKFKFFSEFLRDHAPTAFQEMVLCYSDTMSKLYSQYMRVCVRHSERLMIMPNSKADTLVETETSGFSKLLWGAAKRSQAEKEASFGLGERGSVLQEIGQNAIVFHSESKKHSFESLFRSVTHLLMDTGTSEYIFQLDFFGDDSVFSNVFKAAQSIVTEHLDSIIQNSADIVGLLLLTRINEEHRRVMEERRIPCMEPFFNQVQMLIWPRVKSVMELHTHSVQAAEPSALATSGTAKEPHYITRRFAELCAALYSLRHKHTAATLAQSLNPLQTALSKLLVAVASEHGSGRPRLIFLINQYDHVMYTLSQRKVQADADVWEQSLSDSMTAYVQEEMKHQFGRLVQFVSEFEAAFSASGEEGSFKIDVGRITAVIQDFSSQWKGGIESINADVMSSFSSRCGASVLKAVLSQLLVDYTRFLDLVKKGVADPQPLLNQVVPIPTLMYEVKKYSRTL